MKSKEKTEFIKNLSDEDLTELEAAGAAFTAFKSEDRRKIINFLLDRGGAEVWEVANHLKGGHNKAGYELRILRQAGIVTFDKKFDNKRFHRYYVDQEMIRLMMRVAGYIDTYRLK